jgi:hypothetical protein
MKLSLLSKGAAIGAAVILQTAILSSVAMAADETLPYSSRAAQDELGAQGYLRRETVSIKPQVGMLAFQNFAGENVTRAAAGLSVDANLTNMIISQPTNLYIGPSTGAIFSHLGSPTSNFFGSNPNPGRDDTDQANMLILPANLKVGYTFGDMFRVSAHGGGNLLYRSVASAIPTSSGSDWTIYPNVGGDVEVGLTPNLALTLRPDVTLTPANDVFSGMLALGFTIG